MPFCSYFRVFTAQNMNTRVTYCSFIKLTDFGTGINTKVFVYTLAISRKKIGIK